MSENPEPSSGGNSPGGLSTMSVAVGAVGGVLLLTLGLIVGTLLSRAGSEAPVQQAETVVFEPNINLSGELAQGLESRETVADTIGTSDPAVTQWHTGLRDAIGATLNLLSERAPESRTQLIALCDTLTLPVEDLAKATDAPKQDLNAAFRDWVDSLEVAVAECSTVDASMSDVEALESSRLRFKDSAERFELFIRTLDLYFDFSDRSDRPSTPALPGAPAAP